MNGTIQKYLYNQISLIISIVAMAIGITLFITQSDTKMEKNIALLSYEVSEMKSNDLPHIEARIKTLEDDITEIKLNVREILTIIKAE